MRKVNKTSLTGFFSYFLFLFTFLWQRELIIKKINVTFFSSCRRTIFRSSVKGKKKDGTKKRETLLIVSGGSKIKKFHSDFSGLFLSGVDFVIR